MKKIVVLLCQAKRGTVSSFSPKKCVAQPRRIWWGVWWQWFQSGFADRIRVCAGPAFLFSGVKYADTCQGFSFLKSPQFLLCVSLAVKPRPWPKAAQLFLGSPPLALYPLPSLIINCLNLPFGTQVRSWGLQSVPYKQGIGDTERLLCPGTPQYPS